MVILTLDFYRKVYMDLNDIFQDIIIFWEVTKTFIIKEFIKDDAFQALKNSVPKWIWLKGTYVPPRTKTPVEIALPPTLTSSEKNKISTIVLPHNEDEATTLSSNDISTSHNATVNFELNKTTTTTVAEGIVTCLLWLILSL
jgi:hypothetical protein